MRRLSAAISLLLASGFTYANESANENSEKCFPWNAEMSQGETANLKLSSELCYNVPVDKTGVQKIWGSSISSEADAHGKLYENQLHLAHWMGGIKLSNEGKGNVYAEVMVGGQEVLNKNFILEEVAVNKNLQLIGFEQNAARRFMIGLIPATVSIGILTDGHVDLNAQLRKSEAGLAAYPILNSNAYAKAGFGNDVVFVGFSGGVELVQEELGFTADFLAPKRGEKIKVKMLSKNHVQALKGAIDATIKVNGNKAVKNVASFNGYERSDTLVDQTIEVN